MVQSKVTDQHPTSSLQRTFVGIYASRHQVININILSLMYLIRFSQKSTSVIWNDAQLGRYASEINVFARHMANAVLPGGCESSAGRPMRQEPAMINSTSNKGKHVRHPFLQRGESRLAGGGYIPWIH